jgi:hypothetical protein
MLRTQPNLGCVGRPEKKTFNFFHASPVMDPLEKVLNYYGSQVERKNAEKWQHGIVIFSQRQTAFEFKAGPCVKKSLSKMFRALLCAP